jgi:hypothetical protein
VPALRGDPRGPQRADQLRPPPSFRCRDCDRRFVAAPRKGRGGDGRKELDRRLPGERMAPRATARVTGVSRSSPQTFVNALDEGTP